MWGRWSLKNDVSTDIITNRPSEFWSIVNDPKHEIGTIQRIDDGLYMLNYKKKRDFIRSHAKYNVVLSLYTTSAARLHLYSFMERVVKTDGCKLLYTGGCAVVMMHMRCAISLLLTYLLFRHRFNLLHCAPRCAPRAL